MAQISGPRRHAIGVINFAICTGLGILLGLIVMRFVDDPEDPDRYYMAPATGGVVGMCCAIAHRLRP